MFAYISQGLVVTLSVFFNCVVFYLFIIFILQAQRNAPFVVVWDILSPTVSGALSVFGICTLKLKFGLLQIGPKLETQRKAARASQMSMHGGGREERD